MTRLACFLVLVMVCFVWISVPIFGRAVVNPMIVADAGSTGTRVFVFYYDGSEIVSHRAAKLLPGVSGLFKSSSVSGGGVNSAIEQYLVPGVRKAKEFIHGLRAPVSGESKVPIYIYATGGVRSMSRAAREELLGTMRSVVQAEDREAHELGLVHVGEISGHAEAVYGLLSASYINGLLTSGGPINRENVYNCTTAVLDLGGSSLEVASAGLDERIGTDDDVLISYADFGIEASFEKVERAVRNGELKNIGISENPCVFRGDGELCMKAIRKVIIGDTKFTSVSDSEVLAISGFAYAIDFVNFLYSNFNMNNVNGEFSNYVKDDGNTEAIASAYDHAFSREFPNPRVSLLKEACVSVCRLPEMKDLFTAHKYTRAEDLPTRCFATCYTYELMKALGFSEDDNRVRFVLDMHGREVEWTLGVYLKHFVELTDQILVPPPSGLLNNEL